MSTRVRDFRDVPQRFPTVQVFFADNTSVFAGTERSSHANSLDQDSFELTNDFTLYAGKHAITLGTHNEFFNFLNLFTGQLYGEYRFTASTSSRRDSLRRIPGTSPARATLSNAPTSV